jgi:hypothetical protein
MRSGDWMSAATAAARLEKQHKGWSVSTTHGRYGVRFAAVRNGLPSGVCVIIGSFDEVRSALESDRRALRVAS